LLFGPIIGLFIGACTDLLSVALTAGMFHYGYFIAAMCYGLFAGLVRSLINVTHGKQVEFVGISTIIILAVMIVALVFVQIQPSESFDISLFGVDILFYK